MPHSRSPLHALHNPPCLLEEGTFFGVWRKFTSSVSRVDLTVQVLFCKIWHDSWRYTSQMNKPQNWRPLSCTSNIIIVALYIYHTSHSSHCTAYTLYTVTVPPYSVFLKLIFTWQPAVKVGTDCLAAAHTNMIAWLGKGYIEKVLNIASSLFPVVTPRGEMFV